MAAILQPAPMARPGLVQGYTRQDRDTVIALHAVEDLVLEAQRLQRLGREMLVRAFRFLQAQHVGPRGGDQFSTSGKRSRPN